MTSYNSRVLSKGLRSIVSICLILHIGLFVASLSTASVDSTVRDRLLDIAMPYTAAAHIDLGGRAIADVTHSMADWRHHLQYRIGEDATWANTDLNLRNPIGGSRRLERYLTTIAEAAQREDTATAAMLAEPLVERLVKLLSGQVNKQASSQLSSSAPATFQIRVVAIAREPMEANVVSAESGKISDSAPKPTVRWQAGVVPKSGFNDPRNRGWSVVFLEESRLNAKAAAANATEEPSLRTVTEQ